MRHSSSSSSRSGRGVQAIQLRGPSTTSQTFLTALPPTAEELRAKVRTLFHLPPSAPLRLTLADERVEVCEDALPFLRDREVIVVHADLTSPVPPVSASAPEAAAMVRTPPASRARSLLDPLPRTGSTPSPLRSVGKTSAWPAPPVERGPVATEAPGSIRYSQAGGRKRHVLTTLERMAQQAAAEDAERAVIQAHAQLSSQQPDQPQADVGNEEQPPPLSQPAQPAPTVAPDAETDPASETGASPGPPTKEPPVQVTPSSKGASSADKEDTEPVKESGVYEPPSSQAVQNPQSSSSTTERVPVALSENEEDLQEKDASLPAQAGDVPASAVAEEGSQPRPVQPELQQAEPLPSPMSSPMKDSQETVNGTAVDSPSPSPLGKVQVASAEDAHSPSPQKRKIPAEKQLLNSKLLPGKRPRTEGPKNLALAVLSPLRGHPCTAALACKDTAPWGQEYAVYLAQVGAEEEEVVDLPSLMRLVEGGKVSASSDSGLGELHSILQRLLSVQEAFHLSQGRTGEAGQCRTLLQFVQMLITEHTPRRAPPPARRTPNPTPVRKPRRSLPPTGQTTPSAKQAKGELAFLSLMHKVRRDRATTDS